MLACPTFIFFSSIPSPICLCHIFSVEWGQESQKTWRVREDEPESSLSFCRIAFNFCLKLKTALPKIL